MIRDCLRDGRLVESNYWPKHQIRFDQPPFDRLPEEGPWPDFVEYYFECIGCAQLFRLAMEFFHGSGGEWECVRSD